MAAVEGNPLRNLRFRGARCVPVLGDPRSIGLGRDYHADRGERHREEILLLSFSARGEVLCCGH
ncbi:MAG: hypothetical protein O7G84_16580 [Gammaproteobacteria bacterium]|nr:hypothetical protein [Gammaproteobacteria bacterium]